MERLRGSSATAAFFVPRLLQVHFVVARYLNRSDFPAFTLATASRISEIRVLMASHFGRVKSTNPVGSPFMSCWCSISHLPLSIPRIQPLPPIELVFRCLFVCAFPVSKSHIVLLQMVSDSSDS